MIYDIDDTKRNLLETNRDFNSQLSWQNAFQSANTGAAQMQQKYSNDYSSAANEAYKSYSQNSSYIKNSNIVGSGVNYLEEQNKFALQEAYNKYAAEMSAGSTAVEKQRQSVVSGIDEMLTQQAVNINDYANTHYDYLNYLYTTDDKELFKDEKWSKFLKDELDKDGNVVGKRLSSRDEMMRDMYDDTGELTLKGVDFFDQLENSTETFGKSFDTFLKNTDIDWLMEQNEGMTKTEAKTLASRNAELASWSREQNQWNYTKDEYGGSSNLASFREMTGRTGNDATYSYIERFGGMTKKEIDASFDKFKSVTFGSDEKMNIESMKTATDNVFELIDRFGMDKALAEQGFTKETLNVVFDKLLSTMKSGREITSKAVSDAFLAASASSILFLIPGISSFVGLAVGVSTAIPVGIKSAEQQKEFNKKQSEKARKAYLEFVTGITEYSQKLRTDAELDYYTR